MATKSAGFKKTDFSEEFGDPNVTIWPEWQEAEVLAEKWASKHAFEDPEGLITLPRSLRKFGDSSKRACDIAGDNPVMVVVQPSTIDELLLSLQVLNLDTTYFEHRNSAACAEFDRKEYIPGSTQRTTTAETDIKSDLSVILEKPRTPSTAEPRVEFAIDSANDFIDSADSEPFCNGTSKLFQSNKNLFGSDFMLSVLSSIHFLYDNAKNAKNDETWPWDNIYPKAKDGLPAYNPSGKYIVKVFWLGCWRKIVIDDRIPLDINGKPLLVCSSSANEIWTLLLCKALLKVANLSCTDDTDQNEFGHFDVLTALRGWVPESFPLCSDQNAIVGNLIAELLTKRNLALRSTSATPMTPTQPAPIKPPSKSPYFGSMFFLFRAPCVDKVNQGQEKLDLNNLQIPYRILDCQESTEISGEKSFRIRPYFSSGYHRFIKIQNKRICRAMDIANGRLREFQSSDCISSTDCFQSDQNSLQHCRYLQI